MRRQCDWLLKKAEPAFWVECYFEGNHYGHIWLLIHEHKHKHRIFFPERAERSVRLVFVKLAICQRVFGSSRTLKFLFGSLGNIFLVQLVCSARLFSSFVQLVCSRTVREFVNNCWSC